MNPFKLRIPSPDLNVEQFTPMHVHGMDMGSKSPLFLGFLRDKDDDYRITHVVAKMPGYSWYYNQYNGQQYEPASVHIYRVLGQRIENGRLEFDVDMPWSEPFNPPRKK